MSIFLRVLQLIGLVASFNLFAAADPVSWSLSPASGFPATQVGYQSVVQYTLTNHLPFATKLVIDSKSTGGNFTIHDECHDISVASGKSCTIIVAFNPAAGRSTFQLIYGYHNNRIPLPALKAVGTGEPAGTKLSGVIRGLPPTFYKGNTVDFTAIYTNKSNTIITGCTPPYFTSTGIPATIQNSFGIPPCVDSLAPGASCRHDGTVTSTATGLLTIQGHYDCMAIKSAPQASTVVKSNSGCVVHASVDLPLPATTHKFSDNIVSFKFENECSTTALFNSIKVLATGVKARITVSPTLSTCKTSLAAGAECVVVASIIPQDIGVITVKAVTKTKAGAVVSGLTSAKVNAPGYTHRINFINQCPFPVWYGVENNAGNPNVSDPTPNPTPDTYKLAGQVAGLRPVVKSITIPGTYLGEFFPRTGCSVVGNKLVCKTADCNSPAATGTCNGDGASPFTRIEEAFFSRVQGAGYQGTYDISVINGANIPVEMKGLGPANSNPVFQDTPFYCTGAGAPIQPAQPPKSETLGVCNWNFTVPNSQNMRPELFNLIDFNTQNHDCASNCSTGEVCGLGYNNQGVVDMGCGKLIGYWTINQSCSSNTIYDFSLPATDNPQLVFNCATPYSSPGRSYPDGASNYDIYSCNTPAGANPNQLGSCYPSTSGNLCCGAQNWNLQTPYLTAQDSNATIINPDWTTGSPLIPSPYFSILWLKNGCPTSYVYPYDDHSSSFRCYTSDSEQNTMVKMDFDVVFCPGGTIGKLSANP